MFIRYKTLFLTAEKLAEGFRVEVQNPEVLGVEEHNHVSLDAVKKPKKDHRESNRPGGPEIPSCDQTQTIPE